MTQTLEAAMGNMPPGWRYMWCSSGACACLGCANRSGGLTRLGFTKADYEEWVSKNPEPTKTSNV